MKKLFIAVWILVMTIFALGKEIVVSGSQESVIQYKMVQVIEPFRGIDVLTVSFVVPRSFQSPTYVQQISRLNFKFNPPPKEQEQETDPQGNLIRKFYWDTPAEPVQCTVSLQAENTVHLARLQSQAAFPLTNVPTKVRMYLQATGQVQSEDRRIRQKAQHITGGAETEIQAVQSVLHYVVDQLHYILVPERYDALYALDSGKGNCQNYSHLTAALLRASGIPARIVNGITLKKGYDVEANQALYSFEMAQGRHSWIEVYFPDLGWVPFDPQQTEFFVSNRYLRIEVGLDNEKTVQDGLVRWTQSGGSEKQMPRLEEAIESEFVSDRVRLKSEKTMDGPGNLLLTPLLLAGVSREEEPVIATEPSPEPEHPQIKKPVPEEIDYTKLAYTEPFESGNLEFPRNFDFLLARLMGPDAGKTKNELKRNFIVETAEYVTGPRQFAQTFILTEPILLQKISLALHNFGGSGSLWLALSEDSDGQPAKTTATSGRIFSNQIPRAKGYDWVNFDFSQQGLLLTPGRYWFVLNYSGSPIVNWFYSYGKPVGPVDGTRSQQTGSEKWNKILNYEFNFRVTGLRAGENE